MKSIASLTKFGIAAVAVLFLTSCEFHAITGSGNITTENRPVTEDFKSIEAGNGLDIVVEQANKASVTVEADDNVQKHITTRISNGVLYIKSDCNSFRNVTKKVTVLMPVIVGIDVSSGANLNSKNTLKSNSISVSSSSGADIRIAVETEKAVCESSSGSHITIDGKAIDLETASSSGSGIDAEKLLSNNITASASSGSTIDVHPLLNLNADASSGGNINYHNVPKSINKKSSSGGSINVQ
jgi:predicted RNase H-related nuclease YkuK (DUF458 family)